MDRNRRIFTVVGSLIIVAVVVVLVLALGDNETPGPTASGPTTSTSIEAGDNEVSTTSTTSEASTAPDPTSAGSVVEPTDGDSEDPGEESPTDTLPEATEPNAGESGQTPVPLETAIEVGLWRIGVSSADVDAADVITEYVDFNPTPAEGNRFVLIELSGVYLGSGAVDPVFDWELVAIDGDRIEAIEACGVVPDSIYDLPGVDGGGHFKANICFEAAERDLDGGAYLTLGLVSGDGQPYFFSLD